jgi:hypothetical protein
VPGAVPALDYVQIGEFCRQRGVRFKPEELDIISDMDREFRIREQARLKRIMQFGEDVDELPPITASLFLGLNKLREDRAG